MRIDKSGDDALRAEHLERIERIKSLEADLKAYKKRLASVASSRSELEHQLKVLGDYHNKILDYKAGLEDVLSSICGVLGVEHFGSAKAAVGALLEEEKRWKENVGDLETLLSEFRDGTEYKRATDEVERLRKLLVSPCSRIHHWDGTKKCVFCEVRRLRGILREIAHTTILFDPFPAIKRIQGLVEQALPIEKEEK